MGTHKLKALLIFTMDKEQLKKLLIRNLPEVDQRNEIVEEVRENEVVLRLPVLEEYVSWDLPGLKGKPLLSGPILLGFAETAMYACVHAFYGENVSALIVKYDIAFKKMSGFEDILARARIIDSDESGVRVAAEISTTDNAESIATINASYSVKVIYPDKP